MKMLCNERGISNMKIFIWVLLLFVVIHISLKLVPMYMDAYRIEDEINGKIYTAQEAKPADEELKASLAKFAASLDLPLQPEDFDVTRNEDKRQLTIHTDWDVEVKFFWGVCGDACIRLYHFEVSKEGKY